MLDVYKREGSPYWYADYSTPEGRRVQKSTRCRDREAALRIAREWQRASEHEAADAAAGIRRPSDITIGDLILAYDASIRTDGHSERTVESYSDHIRAYIAPYFGRDTYAASITRQHVEGFRRSMLSGLLASQGVKRRRNAGLPSTATVNRCMVTLRRIFDFGLRTGDLRENPAKNLPPLPERPEEVFRALADDEIEALARELAVAKRRTNRGDHATWLRLAIGTGMRDDELDAWDWRWNDLRRRWIRIPANAAKGRKARMIPIVADVLAILEAMPDRRGPVLGRCDRRSVIEAAWERTKLPGRCPSPHDMRHTAASRAAAAGLDLAEMMEMFGWESVATAQRYIHLYGNKYEKLARKMLGGESA